VRIGWKVLLGLGAAGGLALIFLMSGKERAKGPEADSQPPAVEPPPPPAAAVSNPPSFFTRRAANPPPQAGTNGEMTGMSATSGELSTNWEEKVDQILSTEGNTSDKAKQMLEMFPRLPEAGQVEVAKHLCNLVPNEDYAALAKFVVDPQLPAEALDTLVADVLNRPNSLKLPTLLEIIRTPGHPKAGDAKEILGFFIEGDYGDDWAQWQEKLDAWLKENPD
jgi:hypothetical protein